MVGYGRGRRGPLRHSVLCVLQEPSLPVTGIHCILSKPYLKLQS